MKPENMSFPSPAAANGPQLSIEIYSDLICPWCYIGRKRLQQALDALGGKPTPSIEWHPFQLNPTMPSAGLDRRTYRTRKFGSWSRSQAMDEEVTAVGRSVGLEFNFARVLQTPNTFLAHRLVWWAKHEAKQDALCDALFRAYFSQGLDLGDPAVLSTIAGEVGLSPSETVQFLQSERGAEEVHAQENEGRRKGIAGVPFFTVNGTAEISGAQPPSVFLSVFKGL